MNLYTGFVSFCLFLTGIDANQMTFDRIPIGKFDSYYNANEQANEKTLCWYKLIILQHVGDKQQTLKLINNT